MVVLGMQMMMEAETLAQNAALCRSLGLDFVEMHMNLPECQPVMLDAGRVQELKDKHGIFFTLHLPEDMDIAHMNPTIREAWLSVACQTVETARAIGAPILNLHMQPGVHFTLPDRKIHLLARYGDDYMRHIGEFGRRMQDVIGGEGPMICLENTGKYDLPHVCRAVEALLAYPCFGLTWDVGHDRGSGWKDRPFIEKHISHLRHMHLHDGDDRQNHQPLGEGDIDWRAAYALAEKRGCRVVLEVKTLAGIRHSLEKLREITGG